MDNPILSCIIPKNINPNKYSQKYTVDVSARNGHFIQSIEITLRNMRYHYYSKVEEILNDKEKKIIREFESVDSEQGFVIMNLK